MKVSADIYKGEQDVERDTRDWQRQHWSNYYLETSSENGLIVVEAAADPQHKDDAGHLIIAEKSIIKWGSAEQRLKALNLIESDEPELAVEEFLHLTDATTGSFQLNEGVVLQVLARGQSRTLSGEYGTGGTVFRGEGVPELVAEDLSGGEQPLGGWLPMYAGAVIREYAPVAAAEPVAPQN